MNSGKVGMIIIDEAISYMKYIIASQKTDLFYKTFNREKKTIKLGLVTAVSGMGRLNTAEDYLDTFKRICGVILSKDHYICKIGGVFPSNLSVSVFHGDNNDAVYNRAQEFIEIFGIEKRCFLTVLGKDTYNLILMDKFKFIVPLDSAANTQETSFYIDNTKGRKYSTGYDNTNIIVSIVLVMQDSTYATIENLINSCGRAGRNGCECYSFIFAHSSFSEALKILTCSEAYTDLLPLLTIASEKMGSQKGQLM